MLPMLLKNTEGLTYCHEGYVKYSESGSWEETEHHAMFSASFLVASLALAAPAFVLGKDTLFGPFDGLHQAIRETMDK